MQNKEKILELKELNLKRRNEFLQRVHRIKKILIVDDEPFNIMAAKNLLQVCGV